MGIKQTVRWVTTEWGLFSKDAPMSLRHRARWVRQWVPFGLRTAAYGTISLTLGPLTPERSASRWAAARWSRASAKGLDISIEAGGLENVPPPPHVFASNHQSLLDILVLGAVLPGDFRWAAKRKLMSIPFLGWHLRLAGHVPVDRGGGKAAAGAVIERFVDVLRRNKSLLIFPEGTRSEDGEVKPFKDGGFIAAVRGGAPIVPIALEGAHRIMAKHAADTGSFEAPSRTVYVQIGHPIHPSSEGTEEDRVAELRERTRDAIVEMHEALKRMARS